MFEIAILLHLIVPCYALGHFYMMVINNDKKSYNDYKILLNNKDELKLLIKNKLKIIMGEELFFRVYMVEVFMKLFIFNMNIIALLWSIIYATYIAQRIDNTDKYIKFAYIFLLSYYVLINCSLLVSCILHCYAELLIIVIRIFLFNQFNYQPNNKITIKNNLKKLMPEKLEFAEKDEVEKMLNEKKLD